MPYWTTKKGIRVIDVGGRDDDEKSSKRKLHEVCPKCSGLADWEGGKEYSCTRCWTDFIIGEGEQMQDRNSKQPIIVQPQGKKGNPRLDDDGELPKGARYIEGDEKQSTTYFPASDRIE